MTRNKVQCEKCILMGVEKPVTLNYYLFRLPADLGLLPPSSLAKCLWFGHWL